MQIAISRLISPDSPVGISHMVLAAVQFNRGLEYVSVHLNRLYRQLIGQSADMLPQATQSPQ